MAKQVNVKLRDELAMAIKRDALDLNLGMAEYAEISFQYFLTISEKTRRALVQKNRRGK